MKQQTIRSRFLGLLGLCFGMTLTLITRTYAQQKPAGLPPHFTEHAAAKYADISLLDAVTALDRAYGLNILIDGTPLVATADIEFNGTLAEALDKVADKFDYTWKVGHGNIVLFNKRFRNKDDAPQGSILELTHLIRNVANTFTLANVNPDPALWPGLVRQLGQSLSEQHWSQLKDKKRILASDLNPEQLELMRSAVAINTFSYATQDWTDLAERVRNIKTAYLIAHRLPGEPGQSADKATYTYEIVWRTRDGSLASDNILTHFFGNN